MSTHTAILTDGNLPLVLQKADIAQLLRKSERTVERLRRSHQIPDPVVPGRWSRDSILQWLAGGTPRRGRR